ncbi:hypothetical protein BN2476_630107 [Paraburkholderia piptadeniae]|uniref:Uncharacterized protein n=1 Tax=Paraburkholderia piptadeniae TaxID=1701573 RepID=A0A1N7SLM9_9BURK|nr:hypothetical protein BN2476_630107 [Paraburkholderia piptadeniae]
MNFSPRSSPSSLVFERSTSLQRVLVEPFAAGIACNNLKAFLADPNVSSRHCDTCIGVIRSPSSRTAVNSDRMVVVPKRATVDFESSLGAGTEHRLLRCVTASASDLIPLTPETSLSDALLIDPLSIPLKICRNFVVSVGSCNVMLIGRDYRVLLFAIVLHELHRPRQIIVIGSQRDHATLRRISDYGFSCYVDSQVPRLTLRGDIAIDTVATRWSKGVAAKALKQAGGLLIDGSDQALCVGRVSAKASGSGDPRRLSIVDYANSNSFIHENKNLFDGIVGESITIRAGRDLMFTPKNYGLLCGVILSE